MTRFGGQHAPTMSPKTGPGGRIDTLTGIIHIGKSICVTGEITSNEDLTIEGKVVGRIELNNHNLVIGSNAQARAEITAKSVQILGSVIGNVSATGQVEICEMGTFEGDIVASSVNILDGAHFQGSVDMTKPVVPVEGDLSTANS